MSDTATTTATASRGIRKTLVGEVVSDKMDKTVVVRTVSRVPLPRVATIV